MFFYKQPPVISLTLTNKVTYPLTVLFFLPFFIFASCNPGDSKHHDLLGTVKTEPVKNLIRTEVFAISDNKFGYSIYENDKLVIKQEIIPGISGNTCFCSEQDAREAADLMKYKMENGIFPPTINPRELDSLKIITK